MEEIAKLVGEVQLTVLTVKVGGGATTGAHASALTQT